MAVSDTPPTATYRALVDARTETKEMDITAFADQSDKTMRCDKCHKPAVTYQVQPGCMVAYCAGHVPRSWLV